MTYAVVTETTDDSGEETALGIFDRISRTHEELLPLRELLDDHELTITFLMKEGELKLRGEHVAGLAALPDAQGAMKPLFSWLLETVVGYHPDWLIILSADWWEANLDPLKREALVCHEALHCGQLKDKYGEARWNAMGDPVVGIMPHDVEEFHAIARRYGAWTPDLEEFRGALNEGVDKNIRPSGRDGSLSMSTLKIVRGGRK